MAVAEHEETEELLISRLFFWTNRLICIDVERDALWARLADAGYVGACSTPMVTDLPVVARLKESLLRLQREATRISVEMASVGAVVVDPRTYEVLIAGGPIDGSYLSWMPGEPRVGWWRRRREMSSERCPLAENDCKKNERRHHH